MSARGKYATRGVAIMLAVLGITGCIQPETPKSMNSPTADGTENQSDLAEFFAYQNDQGMIADASISDIHFVPHSIHLSGAGEARLARYAELLGGDGGTINYQTSICDDELIEARLAVARSYLAKASPTGPAIHVALGLPGGRGMTASEAGAGHAVAKQPEPRGSAYKLANGRGASKGE